MVTEEFLLDFYRVNLAQSKAGPSELYLGFIKEVVDDGVSYGKATDTLSSHPTWVESDVPRVAVTLEEDFTDDTIRFKKEVEVAVPKTLDFHGYFLATSADNTGLLLSVTALETPLETVEIGDSFSLDFGINIRATTLGLTREGATAFGRNYFYGTGGPGAQFYLGLRLEFSSVTTADTLASHTWTEVGTRVAASFPEGNVETIFVGPDFDFTFSDSHRAVNAVATGISFSQNNLSAKAWFLCDVASGSGGLLLWQAPSVDNNADELIMTPDSNAATLYPWLAFSSLSFID